MKIALNLKPHRRNAGSAVLLIASLDRLARNVIFIADLMEARV